MSKYSSNPSANHYDKLKNIAKYLRTTRDWGIIFKRSGPRTELSIGTAKSIPINDKLPVYPETGKSNKLVGYVDAAYGNNPKKRRSTSGYAFTYSGGAIVHRAKAQLIVAFSSTEAELSAAVTATKTARYIRSVMSELGFLH